MSKKVVVGMSGGVDSSVAAYLLQQQGWDVLGVFMVNWQDTDSSAPYRTDNQVGCNWEKDFEDVRAVCDQLHIPYTTFNFVEEYRERVFASFLEELNRGRTPNPDIICNQEIKFRLFLDKALTLPGVDAVATGHYARISDGKLYRPVDNEKDQTYFLYRMPVDAIEHTVFPLAELTKSEVRQIALEQGFVNADKKDSTGICFIGDIDYRAFIKEHVNAKPGDIVTTDGTVVGQHEGVLLYTKGQRKGLGVGGDGPYFVVEKDVERNQLIVTNNEEDPLLYQSTMQVEDIYWLDEPVLPLQCMVQVRYRQTPQEAKIEYNAKGSVLVSFAVPQRAITEGQSAVFYNGNQVLGGGIISTP